MIAQVRYAPLVDGTDINNIVTVTLVDVNTFTGSINAVLGSSGSTTVGLSAGNG